MARILRQRQSSRAVYPGETHSVSQLPNPLLFQSAATAHRHLAAGDHAVGHVWEEMEKDVRGVWSHEPGPRQFTVVAIKQRYPGHAKQAGVMASQCFSGGYQNRFTIVVDDDIDPTRIDDVVWALSTRCDPETDIDILRRCWSSSLDPMIPPDSKVWLNSRAVIDACRPYEWMKDFPEVAETSPELRQTVLKKFGRAFFGLR
jgi:4-hydroxy-3-polyprenylbenzoate decarboxylase